MAHTSHKSSGNGPFIAAEDDPQDVSAMVFLQAIVQADRGVGKGGVW